MTKVDEALEAMFGEAYPEDPAEWEVTLEFEEYVRELGYSSAEEFTRDCIGKFASDTAYFDVLVDSARGNRTNRQRSSNGKKSSKG